MGPGSADTYVPVSVRVYGRDLTTVTSRIALMAFQIQSIIPVLLLSAIFLPGCKSAQVVAQLEKDCSKVFQPHYNALVLNYETKDLGRLFSRIKTGAVANSLKSRFSCSDQKATGHMNTSAPPEGEWSQARIQIVYPHPDGSTDKGLAKLVVTRHSPASSDCGNLNRTGVRECVSRLMLRISGASPELAQQVSDKRADVKTIDEEIWQLDLPKDELDILLSELSQRGFFNRQERPRGEATVSISVDQGELSKRWTSEPRLEDLMKQIYDEGELSAFNTQGSKAVSVSMTRTKNS